MDGMSGAHKVAWVALHVLVFAVPLAISNANWIFKLAPGLTVFALPLTYDQFDIVKVFVMRACALVGVGAWSADLLVRGGKLRRTRADFIILAFLTWVLITSFTSVSPATAIFGKYRRYEGFLSFLTYAIVYFLVVQLVDRPSRSRSLAHTFVVSGAIVAAYGFSQFLGIDPIQWGTQLPFEFNRGFATFGNPDLLGGFLVLLLPIALVMALAESRRVWRGIYWAVFLVSVAAWLTAFVRSAWIGGVVALGITVVAAALAKVEWGLLDWTAAGVGTAISGAVVARSLRSDNPVLNIWTRMASIFKLNEGSALTRFEIWQAAVRAVKERPILGFGADTFRLVFPHTKPLTYTRDAGYLSVADNVHNYPLQLAAGIGLVGAFLLYGLFGWILFLGAPSAFRRDRGAAGLIVTGFWAAAVGYIVHLMFGLSVTGSSVFLWLSLAMVVAPTARVVEIAAPKWGMAAAFAMTVVVSAASVYNIAYIVADNDYLHAQFNTSSGGSTLASIQSAIRLNPFNDMYRAQLGQTYAQQMAVDLDTARQTEADGKDPQPDVRHAYDAFVLAERAYQDVIALVPTEFDNYVFLAALYNQAGNAFQGDFAQRAVKVADRGIAVEPYGPAIRLQKALALWTLGRLDSAATVLEAAVLMDPNYAEPMQLLGDTYARLGEYEKARAQYDRVLVLQPGDARATAGLKSVEASLAAGGSNPAPK